jgi:hypothetical protein
MARGRKVRSPQGSVPANGRGPETDTESATEKIPPWSFGFRVRVKWCGKSAPRQEQFCRQGKPHAEQDQIGEEERPAPFDFRVGRLSRAAMRGLEE